MISRFRSRHTAWAVAASVAAAVFVPLMGANPAMAAPVCNTIPVQVDIPPPPGAQEVRRALPYPSSISVSGLSGTVSDVDISFNGVAHPYPEDMDAVVVAPNGANLLVMSDDGGNNGGFSQLISGVNLTFSDEAAAFIPSNDPISSGTYKPFDDDTDFDEFLPAHADTFFAPAPTTPSSATALSAFDGASPNGTWSLYLIDDDPGPPTPAPQGFLNGWCVNITTAGGGPSAKPPADFDGDAKTDYSVYRPSNNTWFVTKSTGGQTATPFGTAGDIPVPGDYNGNGSTDTAVFRPSNGVWYVHGGTTTAWGAAGDIPVPGDYNGNGTTDLAVFRPSTGTWFVQGGATVAWGTSGDIPVPGDYNGNGTTDIAVYRSSTATWFVQGGGTAIWGTAGDIPVPGDYDGNGTTDVAVFRPSAGAWYTQGGATVGWGTSGDIPAPGDYDGDAKIDQGVFRPANGTWFVKKSTGGDSAVPFGASGDRPLPLPSAIRAPFFP